jgi:hypothetical protein
MYVATSFGIQDLQTPMFRTGLESILYMFVISLGEYKAVYEEFNLISYSTIAKVLLNN